jgi:uncharacterized protein
MMHDNPEIRAIQKILLQGKAEGKVLLALLYGSYAGGEVHTRSDIDLALFLKTTSQEEEMEIIDSLMMAVDQPVSISRLNDEEESPFVVQEALKGNYLIEPDWETFYEVSRRVLHEAEQIRFRRE